jgi:hypothetical protein
MNRLPQDPNPSHAAAPDDEYDDIPIEQDPDAAELEKFWIETGRGMLRDSIKSLDETARQVIGVAGVLEGLYFHAIAYSDLRGTPLSTGEWIVYLAPIALLLVSLGCAFWVFYPNEYDYDLCAWDSAKRIHEAVKGGKQRALFAAALFLVLGVLAILVAMFLYLG